MVVAEAGAARAIQPAIVPEERPAHGSVRDWIAAAGLFAVTAAVILWQNAHLAVLWDLSYVLDTADRIALGRLGNLRPRWPFWPRAAGSCPPRRLACAVTMYTGDRPASSLIASLP